MSNFFIFDRDRTRLDERIITPKFKTIYPNFATWKAEIKKFGIADSDIIESDFHQLQTMIGNAHLKFKTDVKNYGYLGMVFKDELFRRKKYEQFALLDTNALLSEITDSSQILYTLDRRENGDAELKYGDNKVVNQIKTAKSPIDYYNQLKEHLQLQDPHLLFLIHIANRICLPLQPLKEVF